MATTQNKFYIKSKVKDIHLVSENRYAIVLDKKKKIRDERVDSDITLQTRSAIVLNKTKVAQNERKSLVFEFYIKTWINVYKGKRVYNTKLYVSGCYTDSEWKERTKAFNKGYTSVEERLRGVDCFEENTDFDNE